MQDEARRDERIDDRRGKRVLRRKPVIDRDHAAACPVRERAAERIVGVEAAGNQAAAVEVDQTTAREAVRTVEPQRNGSMADGDPAILDGDRGHGRLRKLHQLGEAAPALVDAEGAPAAPQRDHGEKASRLRVQRRKVRLSQRILQPEEPGT